MGDKTYNPISDDRHPVLCHHQATQTRECPNERLFRRKTVTDTPLPDDALEFEGFIGENDLPPSSAAAKIAQTPLTIPPTTKDIDFGETIRTADGRQALSPNRQPGPSSQTAEKASAPPSLPPATRRLDITRALTVAPPPRDFALPCLRAGTVGGLVSPGGAGKSMLAAQLALMVATGCDTIPGLRAQTGWQSVPTGRVHYASFEDGEEDAATRLHSIWTALGSRADSQDLQRAAANLSVDTLTGVRPPDLLDGGEWSDWLLDACKDKRLVLIDTLRMSHLGDENDSGAMARLLATMQGAAMQTGAAILFLHHISKGAALSGMGNSQQAARGSSVITDNARGQFFLSTMTEEEANNGRLFDLNAPGTLSRIVLSDTDTAGRPMRTRYIKFGVAKSNYSAPWPDVWLRRDDHGVLSCAQLGTQNNTAAQSPKKIRNGAIQA